MSGEIIKILLVEDNPGDARLLEEMLKRTQVLTAVLVWVETLDAALQSIQQQEFHIILLDLSLPDEQGLETLLRMHEQATHLPVIVLTGIDDESTALRAVKSGAQDYLMKGQFDINLLSRAIRYAIERQQLQHELEQARRREQRETEMRQLDRLSQPSPTSVTAQMFGIMPLHRALPESFQELVSQYGQLLEQALEERAYKVDHNTTERLRSLVEQLGFLKAGPRDVVELHSTALKRKVEAANSQKAQAYLEEGRLMVLQMMGYLATYYRNHAMGLRGNAGISSASQKGEI